MTHIYIYGSSKAVVYRGPFSGSLPEPFVAGTKGRHMASLGSIAGIPGPPKRPKMMAQCTSTKEFMVSIRLYLGCLKGYLGGAGRPMILG